jgi:hypothetical protein
VLPSLMLVSAARASPTDTAESTAPMKALARRLPQAEKLWRIGFFLFVSSYFVTGTILSWPTLCNRWRIPSLVTGRPALSRKLHSKASFNFPLADRRAPHHGRLPPCKICTERAVKRPISGIDIL